MSSKIGVNREKWWGLISETLTYISINDIDA